MPEQEIENLRIMSSRLSEEINNLEKFLDELITDGNGHLYDLKNAVGPNSDLGNWIATIGASVISAREKVGKKLYWVVNTINEKISEAENYNAQAIGDYSNQNAKIQGIDFFE